MLNYAFNLMYVRLCYLFHKVCIEKTPRSQRYPNPQHKKKPKNHTQSNSQIDDKVFIIATYIVLSPLELKPNDQEASAFISLSKVAIPFPDIFIIMLMFGITL